MTQKDRLLQALQTKGELYVYEIMAPRPGGLGIAQYNARIKELREEGHRIINQEPGHFVYKTDTAVKEDPMTDDVVKSRGYQRFKQTALRLKGKKPPRETDYEHLPKDELEAKKEIAEKWLRENTHHGKYEEALQRYERLCDELMYREAQEVFGE